MMRPLVRNSNSPASTLILLLKYLAGGIWQATKYCQIRVYSRIASASTPFNCGACNFTSVGRIAPANGGAGIDVVLESSVEHFDKVIFTGPVNVLQKVADDSLVAVEHSGRDVEYLGVLCMALVTRKPLTEFYILNIDRNSNFGIAL